MTPVTIVLPIVVSIFFLDKYPTVSPIAIDTRANGKIVG